MVEQFLNHIQRHNLCKTTDKILLAVSGGVDSMVMLHFFKKAGFDIGVAHCNFSLRNKESDEDERFVEESCSKLNVPFFVRKFDTLKAAADAKTSVQVTARELRYRFFEEIASGNQYKVVATAHHLDDSFETILINLTRGTGLTGIQGIPVRNGIIIRPLMFTNRVEIMAYAEANGISWREDSSNAKDDYQRNFIRHQVVPKLQELNPSLPETLKYTLEKITGGFRIFSHGLQKLSEELCHQEKNTLKIDFQKLLDFQEPALLLWELIKGFGFNYNQCADIVRTRQSGKVFLSADARLNIDRDFLIIDTHFPSASEDSVLIYADDRKVTRGNKILSLQYHDASNYVLSRESVVGQFDVEGLQFPLIWRQIRAGDAMVPLGMSNRKKISDILIDTKVPVFQKDKLTVIESNGEIVWIEGIRINDKYKVTPATKKILVLQIN